MRSLRGRLLLSVMLASATVLLLLGIAIYAAMSRALLGDLKAALRTDHRILAGMVEQSGSHVSFEADPQQLPEFASAKSGRFYQVWLDNGVLLARSPSLNGSDLPRLADETGRSEPIELPGDRRGLASATSIAARVDEGEHDEASERAGRRIVHIVVAAEPLEAMRTLRLLAWMLGLLEGGAVLVMVAALYRAVGRGLRPVRTMAAEIDSLRETELSRRLGRGAVPAELLPIVDKLNNLLARLEGAFSREKSITADVAHELRTPLAGLRMTMDVCRSRPRDRAAYEAAMDTCLGIADRMEAMAVSLLMLARSDSGQLAVHRQNVDLAESVGREWTTFSPRASARKLRVEMDIAPATVCTDPEKLGIILRNIFDNAVSYCNEGGEIRIAVSNGAGREGASNHAAPAANVTPGAAGGDANFAAAGSVQVSNTGSAVAPADMEHIFERFWRGDPARGDGGGHCGLGLSLCQRIMTALGGRISAQSGPENQVQFVLRLELPAAAEQNLDHDDTSPAATPARADG